VINGDLDQFQIDQLLTAISSGEAEVDNTMQTAVSKGVKVWDFRRPIKFSKEQLRTVTFIHETFARLTTTSMAAQLRAMVRVHSGAVDQLSFEDFLRSMPSPTSLAIINMDPLNGSAILVIEPAITFAIIDRLFGGPGENIKVNRELSEIERAVMESIIVRILGNLREAWSQVVDLRPRLGQIETNPQFVQIVPPTEMVIQVTLETKIENVEGMMYFCIPYLTIEQIISKLSAQYWYSTVRRGATTENLNVLRDRLSTVKIPLVAEVGNISLPMKDILALKPGDIIRLSGTRVGDPMVLKLGNRPKFECQPGVVGKKLAVQVTRKIEEIEEGEFEELASEGDEE